MSVLGEREKLMRPGLVSVMMPAYNAAGFIGEAIVSVLAQTYPRWELLVINDGSTDATADIASQFSDPRIRLVNKRNGGESSARNLALDHSQGEFIAYLDADDVYLPHHLAVTIGYLNSYPRRDAVYTDGYHIDRNGHRLKSLQSRRRGPFEGRVYEEAVLASDVFGPPVCVVLRHELVAKHHLRYDSRIVIGPDWDFFVRYADLSEFGYLDDHTCLYRVHQTNISTQLDWERRAAYLVMCREKAIKMKNFKTCSPKARTAVFYDLLINLLASLPESQKAVTSWPEFASLPIVEQARLFRLMASDGMVQGSNRRHVSYCLQRARALNSSDERAKLLDMLYTFSPRLCEGFLRARSAFRSESRGMSPFADLR